MLDYEIVEVNINGYTLLPQAIIKLKLHTEVNTNDMYRIGTHEFIS